MQTWMPMQRWQPGGVRCWMSGAGHTSGVPGMKKAGCWRVEGPHKSLKEILISNAESEELVWVRELVKYQVQLEKTFPMF